MICLHAFFSKAASQLPYIPSQFPTSFALQTFIPCSKVHSTLPFSHHQIPSPNSYPPIFETSQTPFAMSTQAGPSSSQAQMALHSHPTSSAERAFARKLSDKQKQENPLCTNPTCPSSHPHNKGVYNLNTFANEATRKVPIPKDVRGVLYRLQNTSANRSEDYEFLAKFAVAHQSHRGGWLPVEITNRIYWTNNPRIVEILGLQKTPKMARPLTASAFAPGIRNSKAVTTVAPVAREGSSAKAPVKKEEIKPVAGENRNRFSMLAENDEEE